MFILYRVFIPETMNKSLSLEQKFNLQKLKMSVYLLNFERIVFIIIHTMVETLVWNDCLTCSH